VCGALAAAVIGAGVIGAAVIGVEVIGAAVIDAGARRCFGALRTDVWKPHLVLLM
jgi:hypothetical protein